MYLSKSKTTCQYCNLKFISTLALTIHKTKHFSQKPLNCEENNNKPLRPLNTQILGESQSPVETEPIFPSNSEENKLNANYYLRKYSPNHEAIQQLRIQEAEAKRLNYIRNNPIKIHRQRRNKKKTYKCKEWKRTFIEKKDLRQHSLAHERNQELAEQSLSTKSDKEPMRTLCTQSHECLECNKKFYLKQSLREHAKVHERYRQLEKLETIKTEEIDDMENIVTRSSYEAFTTIHTYPNRRIKYESNNLNTANNNTVFSITEIIKTENDKEIPATRSDITGLIKNENPNNEIQNGFTNIKVEKIIYDD